MGIRYLSRLAFAAMVSVASLDAADTPKQASIADAVERRDKDGL